MDRFQVSIIIPVYNTGILIERCLLPLLSLGDDSLEIICVNDGSTDESLNILQNINKKFPKLKVVSKDNGGLSSARNSGLKVAQGKYVFFLDSDDWINIDSFIELKKHCDYNYDIIHGNFNYTYDDREAIKNKVQYEVTDISGADFLKKSLLTNGFSIPVWINLYKKDFLEANELYFMEGIYHEDEEFNIRAFSLAENICSKNIYFYQYYQRPGSITNNMSSAEKRFCDILIIRDSILAHNRKYLSDLELINIIETYLSLVVISGYIRLNNKSLEKKYYLTLKSLRLDQSLHSYRLEFLIVKKLLKWYPRLFLTIYKYYFRVTSKKV